jgi:hypothetical protein
MIARWPEQGWHTREDGAPSDAARMLALLTRLDDRAGIGRFLEEVVAAGRHDRRDSAAIVQALGRVPPPQDTALLERIVAGTAAASPGACAGLLARAVAARTPDRRAELAGAATRLVEALPGNPAHRAARDPWGSAPEVEAGLVVDLLTGLAAIDAGLAGRVVDHVLAWPQTYGMDAVLVPAARALVGAGAARGPGAIERLRAACLSHLRARAAEPLAPPADWSRASALPCRCRHCRELARYLADPGRETWVLRAVEADRRHVEQTIREAGCDLDTTTDRRGRPYGLVCTKNQASYERRARQRARDLEDLARLGGQ